MGFTKGLALEADLLLPPDSFLVIHLTEFKCVSSALIVYCPTTADCTRWLEKTQKAQVCENRRGRDGRAPGAQKRGAQRGEERDGSGCRFKLPSGGRRSLTIPKSREDSLEPAAVPVTGKTQDSIP